MIRCGGMTRACDGEDGCLKQMLSSQYSISYCVCSRTLQEVSVASEQN